MDPQLDAALDAAFPGRAVETVEPAGISWNEGNRTVRVAFADGERAYLKVAVDGDGTRARRERAALAFVGANYPVQVPTVLAADPEGDPPYLAAAELPGPTVAEAWVDADADERESIARAFGRALASVHAPAVDSHGHLVGGGADGLDLDAAPWSAVLVDTIEEFRDVAASDRLLDLYDEVIAAVESNRDRLDGAPPALVHTDPAMPNALSTDEGVTLIDWEIARAGDPAWDLHRVEGTFARGPRGDPPDRLVAALREGYRERAGSLPEGYDDRCPVYDAVALLSAAGHVEKSAEHVGEPIDEFAAWVREEMDRRLAAL